MGVIGVRVLFLVVLLRLLGVVKVGVVGVLDLGVGLGVDLCLVLQQEGVDFRDFVLLDETDVLGGRRVLGCGLFGLGCGRSTTR